MKSIHKINLFRIIFLLFLAVVVFLTFKIADRGIEIFRFDSAKESLREASAFYEKAFESAVQNNFSILKAQSLLVAAKNSLESSDPDLHSSSASALSSNFVFDWHELWNEKGDFSSVFVADKDGYILEGIGSVKSVFDKAYFWDEIQKESSLIVQGRKLFGSDEFSVVLVVPLILNGTCEGVVAGILDLSFFQKMLIPSLKDTAFVLDDKQILASTEGFVFPDSDAHSVSDLKTDSDSFFADGKHGLYYIQTLGAKNQSEKIHAVTYVSFENKSLMLQKLSVMFYIITAILIVVFLFLILLFFKLEKEFKDVRNDVEKYKIASEQNQSCIFEYDLVNRKIKFSGNYEYVLGKIKNPIDLMELRKLYVNIHEDDRNVMTHMDDFFEEKQEKFISEIRFRCYDGEFRWFKLTGTSVVDEKSKKIVKFVGNFTNVNSQRIHEQELLHIAETDMLSGLLNKTFFQKNVTDFLSRSDSNFCGAFFIIDLDNFKTTNDTLGHAMGDIAIRDTSQKISLIFSQKDIIGRIGGDEFCVFMCLENVNQNMFAKIIMEKAASLNENLQEYYYNDISSVRISASVGIALWPEQGKDFNELYRHADAALYHVKQHGKDGNAIFSKSMENGDKSFYE